MTNGERTTARSSATAFPDELTPYVGAVAAVALLGTPAEAAVPIVRRLRGRSGVSAAPGLVNLLNGVLALGVVHFSRRRPALRERWRHRHVPRWAMTAGLGYLTLSPAATAGWQRAVVLPGRSPLWGGCLSPIGLLQVAIGLLALHRLRRTTPRETAEQGGRPR